MTDEEYLSVVRLAPCLLCGAEPPYVSAHHLTGRGWREHKRNDYEAVPICDPCHKLIHGVGLTEAMYRHQVKPAKLISWVATHLAKYFLSKIEDVRDEGRVERRANAPF